MHVFTGRDGALTGVRTSTLALLGRRLAPQRLWVPLLFKLTPLLEAPDLPFSADDIEVRPF